MNTTDDILHNCAENLTRNGFEVFIAADTDQARQIFMQQILPSLAVKTVSWGDSLTMKATGVLKKLEQLAGIEIIRTFEKDVPWKELIERRRQALLCDLFLSGSNAVTADGRLVNLDMIGNRTGGITFGPKKVTLFIGRNKITSDLESAVHRIKNIAAPLNAKRHGFQTPCAKTGRCHDCSSPQRICNSWSILDKCYPKGRIKIFLIDKELGL